ncbi:MULTISPECIES: hypothetical protein [unclassified Streptomyces]|uniref:hypothetical protein n=1 Tax=unclassified Streptomyces TaxID=2593676 RepID=UPI00332F4D28
MALPTETLSGIEERQAKLRKRGFPLAAENIPPIGQAALWYTDVIQCVPSSGRDVARQLARLCGDDSEVTVPWRSLADAVGVRDSIGRHVAYAQRGVEVLTKAGWLEVETTGRGRAAKTKFHLMPGECFMEGLGWDDGEDWLDEAA